MSVVVYEKPIQHISLADWYASVWQQQQTNDTRRNDAFNLRQDLRQLRNETKVKTDWDTYHNNVKLADRITELDRWRDTLQRCLDRINHEIKLLREEKFETEKEIDSLPLGIIAECISSRDCRQGTELTYDEGDTELKRELCLVEHVKSILKERCQNTWEKLNRLEEIKLHLTLDVNDKTEAYELDKEQLSLDKNCASITYKINPLRLAKGSISYEAWREHTKSLQQVSDNELADTLKFREALFICRERAKNDMLSQRDYVDFILRKRIYETQKARNEIEWQSLKMKEEMEKIQNDLRIMETTLQAKEDALKLAQTRLENRSYRPGKENSRDLVDKGLKEEVIQLRRTINLIVDKINCAKSTYNALEDQQVAIDKDLADKGHSLMTDIRCLDLRARLKTEKPQTQTDRNIELSGMEKEIPPTY